jgi:hypothetical protein
MSAKPSSTPSSSNTIARKTWAWSARKCSSENGVSFDPRFEQGHTLPAVWPNAARSRPVPGVQPALPSAPAPIAAWRSRTRTPSTPGDATAEEMGPFQRSFDKRIECRSARLAANGWGLSRAASSSMTTAWNTPANDQQVGIGPGKVAWLCQQGLEDQYHQRYMPAVDEKVSGGAGGRRFGRIGDGVHWCEGHGVPCFGVEKGRIGTWQLLFGGCEILECKA